MSHFKAKQNLDFVILSGAILDKSVDAKMYKNKDVRCKMWDRANATAICLAVKLHLHAILVWRADKLLERPAHAFSWIFLTLKVSMLKNCAMAKKLFLGESKKPVFIILLILIIFAVTLSCVSQWCDYWFWCSLNLISSGFTYSHLSLAL